MRIADLRQEYSHATLLESDVPASPFELFRGWFTAAVDGGVAEPNAMTLATVDADGCPSARIVLLKELDDRGFTFYTNYLSRKGEELGATPRACLVFWWEPMQRQVRIEGLVERVAEADSDAYFGIRPRASRLGAWASEQSRVIADRDELEKRWQEFDARFDGDVPRPPHWGGFRVLPLAIEFWQGRRSRLHDRIRFRRDDVASELWRRDRLAP